MGINDDNCHGKWVGILIVVKSVELKGPTGGDLLRR